MKLTFLGAARQVTGSMYLLEIATESALDPYRILIDCGTDMEREFDELETGVPFFPFEPSMLNLVLLTHAHIDHSGNIPNLYRDGYEGQVLCTSTTLELSRLLLTDSAHLHQRRLQKASGDSRKRKKRMDFLEKKGDLYLEKHVDDAMEFFVPVAFHKKFSPTEGVEITFVPAGHLLGAAHIILNITEDGQVKSICFSGDIGRADYPLLTDPETIPEVDYLICETTYGSRNHDDTRLPEEALAEVIQQTCVDIPGRLIIPAFSVGRTQALLYTLNRLYSERGIQPIRVFSDSPLARSSTRVYEKNIRHLNEEARAFKKQNDTLFDFENLTYIESEKASRAISNHHEPCIIISSSGMIAGGRVEQHVAANIGNPYCTILLVGYAAEGTLGWRLMNGQETVRIKDREVPVQARVMKTDVFSGHGDQNDLLRFVKSQNPSKLKKVFLVHGEVQSMQTFANLLTEHGYQSVEIPEKLQSFDL